VKRGDAEEMALPKDPRLLRLYHIQEIKKPRFKKKKTTTKIQKA
jgi:hypothetical protein